MAAWDYEPAAGFYFLAVWKRRRHAVLVFRRAARTEVVDSGTHSARLAATHHRTIAVEAGARCWSGVLLSLPGMMCPAAPPVFSNGMRKQVSMGGRHPAAWMGNPLLNRRRWLVVFMGFQFWAGGCAGCDHGLVAGLAGAVLTVATLVRNG